MSSSQQSARGRVFYTLPPGVGGVSAADLLKAVERLTRAGYELVEVEGELREILAQMKRPGDALLGLVTLLAGTPAERLGPHTGWLQHNEFAAGRRIVAEKAELLKEEPPFFVKAAEEKGAPSPTVVKDESERDTVRNLMSGAVLVGPAWDIVGEERFFVVEGVIVGQRTYNKREDASRRTFAERVRRELGLHYTALDIATLVDGSHRLVETNPLFVAGHYGLNPELILAGCTRAVICAELGIEGFV